MLDSYLRYTFAGMAEQQTTVTPAQPTQHDAGQETLLVALSGAPMGIVEKPAPAAAPQQPAAPAATAPEPATAPATEAPPAEKPVEAQPPTIEQQIVDKLLSGENTPVERQVSPEALSALKELGFESLDQVAALKEQVTLKEQEIQKATQYKAAFDKLTPAMQRAVMLEFEGKSGVDYLRELPNGNILNTPADQLSAKQLLETYRPEIAKKITPEQWEEYKAGIADEALRDRIEHYADVARDIHSSKQTELQAQIKGEQEARLQMQANYEKAVAESIAHTKKTNPVLAGLIDNGTIDSFKSGKLMSDLFYQEDGVTPKPEALSNALKARLFDAMMERAVKGAATKAKSDALLEATSRQPAGPQVPSRSNQTPANIAQADPNADLINMAIQRGR